MKTMVYLLLRSDGGSDGREDDGVSFVEKWRWRQKLGFRDVFCTSCQTQVYIWVCEGDGA
ncbi:hypothetical protein HanPI659440_Chr01g0016091 [Helianthus annuus]|nr:hypothetical protein HanPI659440_Chr01g0016091 [Helianthus annuus]